MNNLSNSFTDNDLRGMITGNNPVSNAYRELLAYREAQGKAEVCEYGEDNGDGSYSVVYGRYPIPSYIKVTSDWPIKIFYAAPQLPAVPDGWALVPIEIDARMMRAAQLKSEAGSHITSIMVGGYDLIRELYSVLLAAAPTPESDSVTDNATQQFESLSRGHASE